MPGYVYFLSNPAMPGLLKIGQTMDTPELRLRQLNTTGVPLPFILEACFLVSDPVALEKSIHYALIDHRTTQNREFFQISSHRALALALPLLIQATYPDPESITKPSVKNHSIGENDRYVLQLLVAAGGENGLAQWQLKDYTKLDHIDLNICIANLIERKFIKCSRESGSYGPVWLATPRGTKFLADHNLIEDWMRNSLF